MLSEASANKFIRLLLGTDLRKLRNSGKVIEAVDNQHSFDELFTLIFHHERPLVMRAADCVEKITRDHPDYLARHKDQILSVMKSADHKELKWHIAQLLSRLPLSGEELEAVWHTLTYWAMNPNESRIVRVNALQGLYDLCSIHPELTEDFHVTLKRISHEMIPSIQARVKKLKKMLEGKPGKR